MGKWVKKFGQLQHIEEGRTSEGGIGVDGKAKLMNKAKTLSKIRSLKNQYNALSSTDSTEAAAKIKEQILFLEKQLKKAS